LSRIWRSGYLLSELRGAEEGEEGSASGEGDAR
jgi:hypothetical protein